MWNAPHNHSWEKSTNIENASGRKLNKASSSNKKPLPNKHRSMQSVDEGDEEIKVSMEEKDASSTHE